MLTVTPRLPLRQADGEFAEPALDFDRTAMLLGDD